jgi:hypothetical protein
MYGEKYGREQIWYIESATALGLAWIAYEKYRENSRFPRGFF